MAVFGSKPYVMSCSVARESERKEAETKRLGFTQHPWHA